MSSIARRWLVAGSVGAIAAIAFLAWRLSGTASGTAPDLRDPQRVAAGKAVYDANCAACHGPNLEGQPDWKVRLPSGRLPAPPHDDSGHTWHHANDVLFALTKHGLKPPHAPAGYPSDMPAFGGTLTDDQIWNVLAYIQSRWSDRARAAQADIDARYRKSQ